MAAMEECLPVESDETHIPERETDSGLDNSSESGRSCDDDRNTVFSSNDSLDCDSLPETTNIKNVTQTFIEAEKNIKIDAGEFTQICPHRTTESKEAAIAVLEVDPPAMLEPNNNENAEFNLDLLSPYFKRFMEGTKVSANFDVPQDTKPTWLDEDKFKRGQKFARDHFFCINFAEMVSLFLIFAVKTALGPLIFTNKSSSPFSAYQRYLSTCERLISWYSTDPWDSSTMSYRNLSAVKMMHRSVCKRLRDIPDEDIEKSTSLGDEKCPAIWSTASPYLLDDFRSACPVPSNELTISMHDRVWFNQADMAATQFAFVGLAVTFPKNFGMHYATDEQLDDFVYMWKCLGYLHGIEDDYNFCGDGLAETQERTRDFINGALKPALRNVDTNWEHMCRCLVAGIAYYVPGVDFEVSLRYVCNVLNLHTPRLAKGFSMWQSFMYGVTKFVMDAVLKIPGMLALNNILIMKQIKRAKEASPSTLATWEKTEYAYMKQFQESQTNIV